MKMHMCGVAELYTQLCDNSLSLQQQQGGARSLQATQYVIHY